MGKPDNAVSKVSVYEDIIKIKRRIQLVLLKDEEKHNFITMIKCFGVIRSTMVFKVNLVKLLDKYQKLKKSTLQQHFMKNYIKGFKEIRTENVREFKQATKNLLKTH